MLVFAPPPADCPLAPGAGFPDHADPGQLHCLPTGLRPGRDADGTPRFFLVRYRDSVSGAAGGIVQVELAARFPDDAEKQAALARGWTLRPIGFHTARARLEGWSTILADVGVLGPWTEAFPTGDVLFAERCGLDPKALQLLDTLLKAGAQGGVKVAVEAQYDGLGPCWPVLLGADLEALAAAILLGTPAASGAGVTADEVAAALLSLPRQPGIADRLGPVTVRALDGNALPDADALLAELAGRLLGDLLVPVADDDPWRERRWRLKEGMAGQWNWDLSIPRRTRAVWRGSWSAAELFAGMGVEERKRHFPALPALAPFAPVAVTVVAAMPLDPRFVRGLRVSVETTGPGGVPERRSFAFPGRSTVERFTAFYPALTSAFVLAASVTATLAAVPGATTPWPRPLPARAVPVVGSLVEITPELAGFGLTVISVEPAVFERAETVRASLRRGENLLAEAILTAQAPSGAPAYPLAEPPPTLTVTAERRTASGTQAFLIYQGEAPPAFIVPTSALEVLEPVTVAVTLDPASAAGAAFVAVTLADPSGRTRLVPLIPGASTTWACWPASVFDPLAYRVQVQHVPLLADGSTAPVIIGPWQDASSAALVITLPSQEAVSS
ncbi:hypothetical protein G3545_21995 [Starkeya sp. ORNL1]|uniref:hypothetical protein n=1 Tax=Starkeya sp. ORNL1 TaxID=2709380 RepID=UPI0014646802|nr:hypothetical protein [Starkeya sp. ORNL1]QJP16078.1 hypothetical protein G3545_21995 [Starkeya sp. ORNL1]